MQSSTTIRLLARLRVSSARLETLSKRRRSFWTKRKTSYRLNAIRKSTTHGWRSQRIRLKRPTKLICRRHTSFTLHRKMARSLMMWRSSLWETPIRCIWMVRISSTATVASLTRASQLSMLLTWFSLACSVRFQLPSVLVSSCWRKIASSTHLLSCHLSSLVKLKTSCSKTKRATRQPHSTRAQSMQLKSTIRLVRLATKESSQCSSLSMIHTGLNSEPKTGAKKTTGDYHQS